MSTINPIRVRFKKEHINFGSIVQSGLVLNLDAGNPASYSGSGTTWTDLSGQGNDGSPASPSPGGSWSTSEKFYIVYNTDGTIKHYNGSTLLHSVSYGSGKTVYVDSSFYSVNSTYGGFSNIKVTRRAWDGNQYTT